MPDFLRPTARWWYDLPDLGGAPPGPALSEALLAEEARHGVTRDVAWAYADAMPALLGPDPMVDLWPLAFGRGAMRAAALKEPVDLDGLVHVQTASPEVCRQMGARVPSFSVRGEECVEALLRHGTAVRKVMASHCVPFEASAPFELTFESGAHGVPTPWFQSYLAEQFLPIVRLDLSVWLCWDRDLRRPCVVEGHDTIIEGRWGPRDAAPEAEPPPWAEADADTLHGEGWAATMLHNHRRTGASMMADPALGWCRLAAAEEPYHAALREAWRAGRPLRDVEERTAQLGALASLRFEGTTARFAWLGLDRVLRLRRGEMAQLTTDHDILFSARRGEIALAPEQIEQASKYPNIVTRALPRDAPEEGSCPVEPGDRFVLVEKLAQGHLERAAGGREAFVRRLGEGPPHRVARWIRDVLIHVEREQPVVIVDAGATMELRAPRPRPTPPPRVTVRDLVERPAAFHRRRVRFRGVYRTAVEVSRIADAWFTGDCPLPMGAWIVEAEGLWLHDGEGRGHFGQYASELRGTITPVDLSRARPITPDRVFFARPYVPLSSEIVVDRGLVGWTRDGRWVTRLGRDGRLPTTEKPERCRVKATFVADMWKNLGVLEWEILSAEPLSPARATAAAPGPEGRFVEIEGQLVPTDRYPRLDGVLNVSPPSLTLSDLRHTLPPPEAVERYRSILGAGRRVTVRGEMGRSFLRALWIADASGPLDL